MSQDAKKKGPYQIPGFVLGAQIAAVLLDRHPRQMADGGHQNRTFWCQAPQSARIYATADTAAAVAVVLPGAVPLVGGWAHHYEVFLGLTFPSRPTSVGA
jgi:hypothetical protein